MPISRLFRKPQHHHDWQRRVVATESHPYQGTNMWGRPIEVEGVICHAEFVCSTCGVTRDDGDCICDRIKGDVCPPRVAYLRRRSA